MPERRDIYCCECGEKVPARLTDGEEIYPHREDLYDLPFWVCDTCDNYVGCHHKTSNPTHPLGNIPNPELRNARRHIHALLDPLWKDGLIKRTALYKRMSEELGWNYHTSMTRSVEEAREAYRAGLAIARSLRHPTSEQSDSP